MVNQKLNINVYDNNRKQEVVLARALFYKLCREYTSSNTKTIGRIVNRDHASVLHGLKQFDAFFLQRRYYDRYIQAYADITEVLNEFKDDQEKSIMDIIQSEKQHMLRTIKEEREDMANTIRAIKAELASLKSKHNHLMRYFSKYEPGAYERYGV